MAFERISSKAAIAAHRRTRERDYWVKTLSGMTGKSCFPGAYEDKKSRVEETYETVEFLLPPELNASLIKVSGRADVRLHMILAAGLMLLLNKYTGESDIVIGTPIYKPDAGGEFINLSVPLRLRFTPAMNFKEMLRQVKQVVVEANENCNFPMAMLAEPLNLSFSPGGDFPLFDVAVLLENIQYRDYLRDVHPNMIFSFSRTEESISGVVDYNGARYWEDRVQDIISRLLLLLEKVLKDVGTGLSSFDLVSGEEKKKLLVDFNDTASDFPRDKAVHQLVEEQVERTPHHTALVCSNHHLTFGMLNEKVNRLARVLQGMGLKPGSIAAIMMEHSLEMVIGILSILKTGAAYFPLNPDFPQERVLSMLQDSGASLLLSDEKLLAGREFSYISLSNFESGGLAPLVTPGRPQLEDLDRLQIPDRSLVDYEKYGPQIGQAMVKNSITIHMSRGCVFNCAFCFKIWPRKYIIRSAENIFNEINDYYRMGIRRFAFVDDLPNFNMEVSSRLFRMIIENGLNVHLHFPNGIRGDILTEEYIDLMVAAGTNTMDLALETTSLRLQKMIRKNLNLKKLADNIAYITRKHPQVILELQILHGIPSETEEEAEASLEFIKNIKWVHFPYIHILNIYPNSDMARIAMEHGISREAIERSADIAYHELPETLPFSREFTRKFQSDFLNQYFLSRERLLAVLPHQMSVLTEDELLQKYNSYLPMEINSFKDLLDLAGISRDELSGDFLPRDHGVVPDFNRKLQAHFSKEKPRDRAGDPLNILLLDLTQYFSHDRKIMYDVVEPPLGLMYLLTHLNRVFGGRVNGKIAKSRIDFDSFEELRKLVRDFQPSVIGIRTLNFYKDFFHKTISLLRHWGVHVPIVAGGPYATSNYDIMLKDRNIDLAVLGEGEITLSEIIGKMLENGGRLPGEDTLAAIPGIAFVKRKDDPNYRQGRREVVLLDRLCDMSAKFPGKNLPGTCGASDNAYIIYTSGSTGTPKGVLVQHNNLVNQLTGLVEKFQFDASFNYLLLASFTFDVSVMHIFTPLITGAKLFVIGDDVRRDAGRLWRFIAERKVDVLNIVPAFMKAILKNLETKIDLKYLFVGGDVFSVELYDELKNSFKVDEIINIYGPTEATINATLYRCSSREKGKTVPIGSPLPNYRSYILDRDANPVPTGLSGELWISGAGVARGYLNRPELTAERFVEMGEKLSMVDSHFPVVEKESEARPFRAYRTGDLCRWLADGSIEFLGRVDSQVKVRGFRIELAEIEKHLAAVEGIKEAIVTAREDGSGDKYLCAYYAVGDGTRGSKVVSEGASSGQMLDKTALRESLSRKLPDYMIPSYFLMVKEIPLTPSGKVDMKALPDPREKSAGDFTAPRTAIEKRLAGIWADVLGRDRESIGIYHNFFDLGGHSLRATILISRIHKQFDTNILLVDLFKKPTIEGLAELIQGAKKDRFQAIEPVEKKEFYPLSPAHKRLYILQQMDVDSMSYNMPETVEFLEELDQERLENTFRRLIARHESLSTSFKIINGEPVQVIHDRVEFNVEYFDAGHKTEQGVTGLIVQFLRPFDLHRAPLFRAAIIKPGDGRHVLVMDMHHVISDALSHALFVNDFIVFYSGWGLAALKIQYKDYSEWQRFQVLSGEFKQQEAYWLNLFSGELPVLNLPTDFPRPPVQSFDGDLLKFDIKSEQYNKLDDIAQAEGATMFMLIFAVFNAFLARLCGQEDIIVGTPIVGRRHSDLDQVIGMFVNTLALRNYPGGGKSFRAFLREVEQGILEAFENQDFQFEDLVDKVVVERDPSRNPIFDVVFTLDSIESGEKERARKEMIAEKMPTLAPVKEFRYESKVSKFDLLFSGFETGEGASFSVTYCTRLFTKERVGRFIDYFKNVLSEVIKDPDRRLSAVEMISEAEKQQILNEFNRAPVYPLGTAIPQSFSEQAKKSPHHIALLGPGFPIPASRSISSIPRSPRDVDMTDGVTGLSPRALESLQLSYRELEKQSTYLAGELRGRGAGPGTIVGIRMGRCLEMVVGILGILSAGAAYLPIDPDYPQERIDYMLADSNADILLTDAHPPNLSIIGGSSPSRVSPGKQEGDEACVLPGSLAYIIYTSGSTGWPKGVLVEHRSVIRLVKNTDYISFDPGHRLLQTGALEFDASTFEIWGALLNGMTLCLALKEHILDPDKLKERIRKHHIAVMWLTSPLFNQLVGMDEDLFAGLKYLLVGGDVLSPTHINRVQRRFPGLLIINGYGPTENTTFSTTFAIEKEYLDHIPIGRPISNSTAFIVDAWTNLVPIGAAGELWVGGAGVARGYMNDPALTSERFVPLPASLIIGEGSPPLPGEPAVLPAKIYRTGDLARWLPDGNIEFLGRKDFQVKIRGFRIELGEIENQLLLHEDIEEAVVITGSPGQVPASDRAAGAGKKDGNRELQIIAYVVSAVKLSVPGLIDFLTVRLPDYMIPLHFVQLDRLPLTRNGKVDRRALASAGTLLESSPDHVPPQNEMERKIAAVWKEVLQLEEVGVTDNFFQQGGDSLKAIQLKNKLTTVLHRDVPVIVLFEYVTIRSFIDYLSAGEAGVKQLAASNRTGVINRAKEGRAKMRNRRRARS